jgi:hypothetical protein
MNHRQQAKACAVTVRCPVCCAPPGQQCGTRYVHGPRIAVWQNDPNSPYLSAAEVLAVLYLATPSSAAAREAMQAGVIGCMTTPAQGNRVPDGAFYACDNGRFGKGWPGDRSWWVWLWRTVGRYGTGRCLWALAPDVPFDAAGTLAESRPWLPAIRQLGVPAAFAAQDGSEDGLIPWGEFDVLFLAGSTEWKTGPAAERLSREARDRGIKVHMGRVNSRERMIIAEWFGCDTADGTYLAFGPDVNLPRLTSWIGELHASPSLMASAGPVNTPPPY